MFQGLASRLMAVTAALGILASPAAAQEPLTLGFACGADVRVMSRYGLREAFRKEVGRDRIGPLTAVCFAYFARLTAGIVFSAGGHLGHPAIQQGINGGCVPQKAAVRKAGWFQTQVVAVNA